MKLSQAGELSLLETLRRRFLKKSSGLVLGIGDDAAVIRQSGNTLLTTDMMVEGVHFDLAWTTPYQLGFKLVSVNVSDIYAMGGMPKYLLLNFSSSGQCTTAFFDSFFDGVEAGLRQYGIALIGGDLSASDRIMLSVTAIGTAKKVLRRKGARIGDLIYVTGSLGDSAAGLAILKKMRRPVDFSSGKARGLGLKWEVVGPLVMRHLLPVARDPAAHAAKATAMMDISDGLLIDLSRMCRESGVGARLNSSDIPVSEELRQVAEYLGLSPLGLALSGGEDYELLFTAPCNKRVNAVCIGQITASGLAVLDERGRNMKVSSRGYQHFSLQG